MLENPGLPGLSQITQSMYAGMQLILPGEVAPSHRHAPAALRFIIEGSGAYTAVNGERTLMNPGDFILTPSMTFHDHGNPTNEATIWMDGLDLPIVNGLVVPCHAGFAPHGEEVFVERNDQIADPAAFWREYADLNLLLFGHGDGHFEDRTPLGGDFSAAIRSGRALLYGDIDNDGDLDLLVTNCGGRARLYRNDVPKQGHWLQVQLADSRGPRDAYGAEVIVTAGNRQYRGRMNGTQLELR